MDVRQPAVVEYQEPGSQAVNQESASQPVVLKQESDCGLKPPSANLWPLFIPFHLFQGFGLNLLVKIILKYPES